MVAALTYSEVRKYALEWHDFTPKGPFYTTISDLRYLLADYGYSLSRHTHFTSYDSLSPLAILEIKRPGRHNHWVVHVKCALDRYVLDPGQGVKSDRRRDWHRLHTVSYANVTRL